MGTNYYWHRDVCTHCNRSESIIHIGKSSMNWCFGLHVEPEGDYEFSNGLVIRGLEDWKGLWKEPGSLIKDESGEIISVEEMLSVITERRGNVKPGDPYLQTPYAMPGPNGLIRHRPSGDRFCLGDEGGTWDFMKGYFS